MVNISPSEPCPLFLRIASFLQQQSMHCDGESSAVCASRRQSNGSHRAYLATVRAAQSVHRYGGASAGTELSRRREQGRLRRSIGSDRAQRGREQGRLCVASAEQRQRHILHRYGESRADYARIQRSNGRDNKCIALARAGQAMHRNSGATAVTVLAP